MLQPPPQQVEGCGGDLGRGGRLLWIGEPHLLTRLVHADVPGVYAYVMRHGSFPEPPRAPRAPRRGRRRSRRPPQAVRQRLSRRAPPPTANPETGTRIFDNSRLPLAAPARDRSAPSGLRGAGHDSQAARTLIDWAAVTARYREGVAGEPRDAWVTAHHPELGFVRLLRQKLLMSLGSASHSVERAR